jgi:hypothetical protein
MSALPAAAYLTDFRGEREVAAGPSFVPFGRNDGAGRGAAPADTMSQRIEAARASGFADGEAAAGATLEARLAQERDAWTRELESERQAWTQGQAERLAQRLAAGLGEVEARIAQTAARVLEPFLQAELRRQAIADLQAELQTLLARDAAVSVSIAGPADLMDALRDRLADRFPGHAVTYLPGSEPDVRITVGQALLETRLAAWAARLKEAVA